MNAEACDDAWYKKLLFVDNFYTDETIGCFGWTWYLTVDMQLFIISIFLIPVYAINKTAGKILIYAVLMAF